MPKKEEKFRLIEELTSYKNDYQFWRIQHEDSEPEKLVKRTTERREKPLPQPVQIDHQTHSPYNPNVYVPFDLYIEPRPIIDLDPREKFEIKRIPTVDGSDKRKELKMSVSPGICLDDIEDEKVRKTVLNYIYKSTNDDYKFGALPVTKPPNPTNTVIISDNVKYVQKKFKFEEEQDESCCCEKDDAEYEKREKD